MLQPAEPWDCRFSAFCWAQGQIMYKKSMEEDSHKQKCTENTWLSEGQADVVKLSLCAYLPLEMHQLRV